MLDGSSKGLPDGRWPLTAYYRRSRHTISSRMGLHYLVVSAQIYNRCVPSKVQSAVKAASTTGAVCSEVLSYVDKCHMSKRALERHSWPVIVTSNHFLSSS